MNAKGIRLFSYRGTKIYVDYSWIIVISLLTWFLFEYFRLTSLEINFYMDILLSVASSLVIFLSLLLHEMVKIYVSETNNVYREYITMYVYGSSNDLFILPRDANSEFKIAISGPVTSFILAFLFIGLWSINEHYIHINELGVCLIVLFEANMVFCVLNLLPCFPFDGGRIMRSILWGINEDYSKSTSVTVVIGKFIAFFIIFFGIFEILISGTLRGFWIILAGLFLFQASNQVYFEERVRAILSGLCSRDLINRDVISISPFLTVDDAINEYFIKYASMSFPVVASNQVLGLLSLRDIRRNSRFLRDNSRVGEVMRSYPCDVYIFPSTFVIHALKLMINYNLSFLPVKDNGKLVGILTLDRIAEYIEGKL